MPRPRPLPANPVVADGDLDAIAAATGRAWACGIVGDLRAQAREVNGGWPGTLREARGQVQVALAARRTPPLSTERLAALARATYASARAAWSTEAVPDLEP